MNLKELRQSKKLSQQTVARDLGVSLRAYQNYEYSQREPSIEMLCKLADYFNVSIDTLVGRSINDSVSSDCLDDLVLKYSLSDTEKRFLTTYLALPNSMRSDLMQFLKIATHES